MPLHPSIVHFPPVLLAAAAVLYGLGLALKRRELDRVAFGFHVAGLLFCIVAIFTGDFEAGLIKVDPANQPALHAAMDRHENLVMTATYGFGLMGIWAFLRQKSTLKWERLAFAGLFLGWVVLLFIGAHLGGKMVYEQGAGVRPVQEDLHAPAQENGMKFEEP
jgi:uncharacterized membrane protein